jgi:peptidylprolyl isomerase
LLVTGFIAVVIVIIAVYYMFGQAGSSQVKIALRTTIGDIVIELRDDMPITTGNFENLVRQGLYDGTVFHRVIAGFMIQGGQIDSSTPTIQDEFSNDNHNYRGTVAMAKTSLPNSATSQFFINVVDNSNRYASFDTTYSVFGKVIEGMDVVDTISRLATDESDRPIQDVTLMKAEFVS